MVYLSQKRAFDRSWLGIAGCALLLAGLGGCTSASKSGGSADDDADDTDSESSGCTDGETQCDGSTFQTCVDGEWQDTEECDLACDPDLGCTLCEPGEAYCDGDTSIICNGDGTGYLEEYCDPLLGVTCNPDTGLCEGSCSSEALGSSYIGCEYYAVVTANLLRYDFDFAVVLANTSQTGTAAVTIEDGQLASPVEFEIPPDSVHVQYLPWDFDLKVCPFGDFSGICNDPPDDGVFVEDGAYHIRSTLPVTVYQFSPLDYTDGDISYSYTNDASLLLPVNALTGTYVIPSWPFFLYADNPYPSMMTIVATEDDTSVAVTPRATAGGGDLGIFTANVLTTVTLNDGDALELLSGVGDLTGSLVEADKPIAIIAGHYATNIPTNMGSQDHLEEQVFPVETLSNSYVVASPAVPDLPGGKERFVRVIAAQDDTTITYEPDIPSVGTSLASVGDFIEIPQHVDDHLITADKKIIVVEYMESGYAGLPPESDSIGDPAMALAVATDQYRTSYLFHAPSNYETNYVNIIAPVDAEVLLDDVAVTGFAQVGSSDFAVAKVELDNGGDGNHFAESDQPFGISVYGYGWCTSYWYPGGLDLDEIPIE
jgi:hypothetical protein